MEGKAKEALTKFQASKSDMDIIVNNNKMLLNSLTIEWLDSVGIIINIETQFDLQAGYNRGFDFGIFIEKSKSHYVGNNKGAIKPLF